jgi:hypothetical protein
MAKLATISSATRLIAVVFTSIQLTGCVLFVPGVDDLRFVDVQPVQVSALDLHDTWGPLMPKPPPTYFIGKIEVASKADIHEIGAKSELNVWHKLTVCKTGASVTGWWTGVYYKGVDINYNSTTEAIQTLYRERESAHRDGEPFIYEVYFFARSTLNQPKGIGEPDMYEPYDFAREPLELCLTIGGGNEGGGYFVSNTVVVPSVEIGRAFKSIPSELWVAPHFDTSAPP